GARTVFLPSPLLRHSSSGRDDGRDGYKANEHEAIRRRVVDPPRFHLANDRQSFVICGIFIGNSARCSAASSGGSYRAQMHRDNQPNLPVTELRFRGSRTVNSVKSPTSLSTVRVPPWCWTTIA